MGTREHQSKELLNQGETFWIWNGVSSHRIGQITKGRSMGSPSQEGFGAAPVLDADTHAVYVVLREAEEHGEHQLSLSVVLELEGREPKVFDLASIEQVNDVTSVDGVASETIRLPTDDAIGLAPLYPAKHVAEDWPARLLRTSGFLQYLDYFCSRHIRK
jgi:hypothetical protein